MWIPLRLEQHYRVKEACRDVQRRLLDIALVSGTRLESRASVIEQRSPLRHEWDVHTSPSSDAHEQTEETTS